MESSTAKLPTGVVKRRGKNKKAYRFKPFTKTPDLTKSPGLWKHFKVKRILVPQEL